MSEWTVNRRETSLVEHVCSHGVGHPNYGSALWLAECELRETRGPIGYTKDEIKLAASKWMTHGCDGCCVKPGSPTRDLETTLIHAHGLIFDYRKALDKANQALAELRAEMDRRLKGKR